MATIRCPYCAEEIQAEAVKCKHCHTWLSNATGVSGTHPGGLFNLRGGLVRPTANRMLAGVCAAFGQWSGVDPTLVRVVYAVATFFTAIAPGIALYVILAFVIPSEDKVPV